MFVGCDQYNCFLLNNSVSRLADNFINIYINLYKIQKNNILLIVFSN